MPELRQNIITRDWVVIASERAQRPSQFAKPAVAEPPLSEFDPECPFCVGNEHRTSAESFSLREGGEWKVRVVPNKYPALAQIGEPTRKINGIYRSINAVGIHEVVIDHRCHNLLMTTMTLDDITKIFEVYRRRYQKIKEDQRIESITIFRNHGRNAGTSLLHPHSQIVATPIVPYQVRSRIDIAMNFFDDNGECIFCRTLNDELSSGERIISETEHFVSFIPYAALSPFHIWIFPKRHCASFEHIESEEISDLAKNLQIVLKKLYIGLNNPDYNYTIRSIPVQDQDSNYFHWYLAIVPRIAVSAGFELGSGMYISTSIPEESAKFLREVDLNS